MFFPKTSPKIQEEIQVEEVIEQAPASQEVQETQVIEMQDEVQNQASQSQKPEIEQKKISEYGEEVFANIGAGIKISILGHLLLKNELTGFEELSGIPGTIGGAVRMNAGAHGKEFKDIVSSVTCMHYDGNIKQFENEDMHFEYRSSMLKEKSYIVLEVRMEFQKGNEKDIKEKMEEYANYRKEKQPIEYPSAGSTFKRGADFITAKLIDEAGLKGYSIGGAEVSSKHAGFIINKGNATAKDILELIEYVKHKVEEKFNKKIELEIEIMGEN